MSAEHPLNILGWHFTVDSGQQSSMLSHHIRRPLWRQDNGSGAHSGPLHGLIFQRGQEIAVGAALNEDPVKGQARRGKVVTIVGGDRCGKTIVLTTKRRDI